MQLFQRKRSVFRPSPSKTKKDSEGVASVVGTILALIVFLSILGIFTNHFVPAMMTSNEHQHDNTVVSQLSQFKQGVDNLLMDSTTSQVSTLSSFAPVTLGSSGVPMFAVGTQSQMNVIPQSGSTFPYFDVSFNYNVPGITGTYHLSSTSGGGVVVNIPNRYYVPQSVLYENDAVLLGQSNGQLMLSDPGFAVSSEGGTHLSLLELSLATPTASNMTYSGTNTVSLTSGLLTYSDNYYTTSSASVITVTVGTPFPYAWLGFVNSTFSQANLTNGFTYSVQYAGSSLYVLTLKITGVSSVSLTTALLSVSPED